MALFKMMTSFGVSFWICKASWEGCFVLMGKSYVWTLSCRARSSTELISYKINRNYSECFCGSIYKSNQSLLAVEERSDIWNCMYAAAPLCLSVDIMLAYNVNVVYIRMNHNDEKARKNCTFYKTLNPEDVNKQPCFVYRVMQDWGKTKNAS